MTIFMACLILVNMLVILEMRAKNKKLHRALHKALEVLEHIPITVLTDDEVEERRTALDNGWKAFLNN
jgi:hypothetical protein